MITQEINKYTPEVMWRQTTPITGNVDYSQTGVVQMTKLEYALYTQSLPFKKGDLLTSKYTTCITELNSYELTDIQEVHRFVTMGVTAIGPLCLNLQTITNHIFNGGGNHYRRVLSHEIPNTWIDKWASRRAADTSNVIFLPSP